MGLRFLVCSSVFFITQTRDDRPRRKVFGRESVYQPRSGETLPGDPASVVPCFIILLADDLCDLGDGFEAFLSGCQCKELVITARGVTGSAAEAELQNLCRSAQCGF